PSARGSHAGYSDSPMGAGRYARGEVMRRADAAVQARSADRSWLRSAGIVAFFTVLGPFAGVVIFSVWFGLLLLLETPPNAGWTEGVAVAVQWTLISMLLGMTTGYSIGFLVAA